METLLRILNAAGGWHPGLWLQIDNLPYIALVIEATDESGPCGLPTISVCHYGEQNGDAMRDPEMLFELGADGATLNPSTGETTTWASSSVAVSSMTMASSSMTAVFTPNSSFSPCSGIRTFAIKVSPMCSIP